MYDLCVTLWRKCKTKLKKVSASTNPTDRVLRRRPETSSRLCVRYFWRRSVRGHCCVEDHDREHANSTPWRRVREVKEILTQKPKARSCRDHSLSNSLLFQLRQRRRTDSRTDQTKKKKKTAQPGGGGGGGGSASDWLRAAMGSQKDEGIFTHQAGAC